MALLNRSLLSKYSPLPANYNFEEILLYQPIAIEIWIRPTIGDAFTDLLEYEVEKNKVSPENAALMTEGGLLQYLSYAMCLEGLPFIWSNFSEAGITLGDTDFSKSITLKDLTYIEAHLRRQVEFLKDKVVKWLNEHSDSFKLYHEFCCRKPSLKAPNPMFNIYGMRKINTDIK